MFKIINVDVDFNGIIIFDYPGILIPFGGKIENGDNILQEFTTTDKGDFVLDEGIALPIMGIDDGGYVVRLFLDELPDNENRRVIFSDKYFYLNVTGDLYISDMSVFWEWEEYTGWNNANVPKGIYKVSLEGVNLDKDDDTLYCYDLILEKTNELGIREIEPRSDSRLY
ncbi:hypothetical protein [Escherichia albertii]|uniref:hypothetical protein n=1 Tax=Escherichia albertii TaxID=208962 RepID=UPI000743FC82|nr:hypothetical protein [Escherichia albertii]EFO1268499.1 hypothetical protein [Escherichia albertii]MCZ8807951.1 hypothetical protein [Escherichia albertii]MCZ8969060.1 hypothetical protein [Escherichia albertii]MCZ9060951.1 hypothetical protein [Escherichia albertii]